MNTQMVQAILTHGDLAREFWLANRGDEAEAWARKYWDNWREPHRLALRDAIGTVAPFSRLLEVGCNSGPNLRLCAETWPEAELWGVDLNLDAILAGQRYCAEAGIENVTLRRAAFPTETKALPAKSFDVVVTCYALAYISPEHIFAACQELCRLASQALVIMEPMATQAAPAVRTEWEGYVEWRHPLLDIFENAEGGRCRWKPLHTDSRLNGVLIVEAR